MATATALEPIEAEDRVFTTEDLLAIPDDGIERWLIDGRIVEVGMTQRNKFHTGVEALVSQHILNWRDTFPPPNGTVHAGEAGVRLRRNPDRTVGIDLVFLAADVSRVVMADDTTTIIDAVPTLAVEILSPSEVKEDTTRKLRLFRDAGVPLVWVIDPDFRTVVVHRPGVPPVMHNDAQELDGGDVLPGFRVPVARLFPA